MKRKLILKDAFLAFLICLNLFLVFQIWFNTNMFSIDSISEPSKIEEFLIKPVKKLFSKSNNGAFSENLRNLMRPQRIIINKSNSRAVLYDENESYQELLGYTYEIIRRMFNGNIKINKTETISLDDYCAVLKRNSVYLDYDNFCDFRLFSAAICGEAKNQLSNDLSVVRECLLSPADNTLNNIAVYIKDYKTGNVMKYVIDEKKDVLEQMLTSYFQTHSKESTLNYSFELNFHKQESGDGSLVRLVFDPLIIFNLVSSDIQGAETNSELLYRWPQIQDEKSNEILGAFKINPMTMRKYTNLTNARVFVENEATLTLSTNGILEYKTIEGGQGLLIANDEQKNNFDIYNAVSAAVNFIYQVNEELPYDLISSLRFNSDIVNGTNQGSYTISFDLYTNGYPILQTDPATGENTHCITMRIENGYLKYYRQFIRKYNSVDENLSVSPVINAVDGLIDDLNSQDEHLNVLNVGRCYVDSGVDKALIPQWNIRVEGIEKILTVK
ncbi:MAG: hypothetical protein IKW59_04920 [Clostridia bacterium]|nr:hypothetical protein [Clostridia bacterium]